MMGALSGLRVLDLSRVLAGPWCGQILADLGAEVIKVERPGMGDDTRGWGPPWMPAADGTPTGEAAYFQSANRGKLSVAIDLASKEGQDLVRRLAAESDILIENYKTGSLVRYGLDYASLSAVNPRLIYCSVTGFGQTGPRAEEPGYDFVVQAMGGLMSITGERDDLPGGGPQKVGVATADLMTGLYATVAIQAAVIARTRTGRGQHCDLALLDVQVAALSNQAMSFLSTGRSPPRYGNAHASIVPYQVFQAQDAEFVIACGNDAQFRALCNAIGRPDLSDDRRFRHNRDRVVDREALVTVLAAHFLTASAAHWIRSIHAVGVPVGAINDVAGALNEPQVQARDMVVQVPHLLQPAFRMMGSPIKLSDTPVRYERPPPMLGQHTAETLHRVLALSKQEIAGLTSRGVIQ